jgi:hypothetical protein
LLLNFAVHSSVAEPEPHHFVRDGAAPTAPAQGGLSKMLLTFLIKFLTGTRTGTWLNQEKKLSLPLFELLVYFK